MNAKKNPMEILNRLIAIALDYDRRGDAAMRDHTVRQILGDEIGLPLRTIRKALREAGLVKTK